MAERAKKPSEDKKVHHRGNFDLKQKGVFKILGWEASKRNLNSLIPVGRMK